MSTVLLTLAILSLFFTLWQWAAARLFPIHQRSAAGKVPSYSILKPLKGAENGTPAALESWFGLRGEFELLLGVASPEDPARELAEGLIEKYPGTRARLVICAPTRGPNAKVSTLSYLLPHAECEHVIISDDDVAAPEDLLEQISATAQAEEASLTCTFYILPSDRTFGNRWEAVASNADFWSQVLQGLSFQRMNFALGAVMATTRQCLEEAGGFEPLLDYLADDYQLGRRIAAAGGQIAICPVPVECHSGPLTLGEAWEHQLRWARTIRTCRPVSYFLSILSNATLWPLMHLAVARTEPAFWIFLGAAVCRSFTAWDNYRRLGERARFFPVYFAQIKDLLQVLVWAGAFTGNGVTWRGERFRVTPGGKLIRANEPVRRREAFPSPGGGSGRK